MALIHADATLTPSKIDLLPPWLSEQPWLDGADVSRIESLGGYRFDDPAGDVGVETLLVRTADGRLLQLPLTYRSAPRDDLDAALIATAEHSALGRRWVYDGCADAVYVAALAAAILTGGCQAELEYLRDGQRQRRSSAVHVTGSGNPAAGVPVVESVSYTTEGSCTVMRAGDLELVVRRVLDGAVAVEAVHTLSGTWPGQDEPTVLATAR